MTASLPVSSVANAESTPAITAIHVLAGIDPRFGGPTYSVPRLSAALREVGVASTLLSTYSADAAAICYPHIHAYPHDFAGVPILRGLRFSNGLQSALFAAASAAPNQSILHSHGFWLLPNVWAGHAAAKHGQALIVSPRGMLAPAALAFSSLKKRLFWQLLQRRAYQAAACYHATSEQEANDIRAFGITAPIAVIGNGVDLPEFQAPPPLMAHAPKTILALGRIHPIKGLDTLIRAWEKVARERSSWRLVICGPDDVGYGQVLHGLIAQLRCPRVEIRGPAFDDDKWATLQSAQLFVAVSQSENFGLSIAEALGSGVPAIVSKGAPWAGMQEQGAGWWIDHGVAPLVAALAQATGLEDMQRRAMGAIAQRWIEREFSWRSKAQAMQLLYAWSLGQADAPEFLYQS
jgi:glycosyltransferase involved in cell wall biosynthesis